MQECKNEFEKVGIGGCALFPQRHQDFTKNTNSTNTHIKLFHNHKLPNYAMSIS